MNGTQCVLTRMRPSLHKMEYIRVFALSDFSIGVTKDGTFKWGRFPNGQSHTIPVKISERRAMNFIQIKPQDSAILYDDDSLELGVRGETKLIEGESIINIFPSKLYSLYILYSNGELHYLDFHSLDPTKSRSIDLLGFQVREAINDVIYTKDGESCLPVLRDSSSNSTYILPLPKSEIEKLIECKHHTLCKLKNGNLIDVQRDYYVLRNVEYVDIFGHDPPIGLDKYNTLHIIRRRDEVPTSHRVEHEILISAGNLSHVVFIGPGVITVFERVGDGNSIELSKRTHRLDWKVVDLSVGEKHFLVLNEFGEIYSYGYNRHGELGLGYISHEVNELSRVLATADHYTSLERRVRELEDLIEYAPGGEGYERARIDFESRI